MTQSTFDAILGALLVSVLASIGWVIRQQLANARATRSALQEMSQNLAVLNTGASAGARAAIADLREDLRNGVRDVTRDLGQLRGEHDTLAERHHSLNGTVVQLAERVNGTQQAVHEIRRDIYGVRDRGQQGSGT